MNAIWNTIPAVPVYGFDISEITLTQNMTGSAIHPDSAAVMGRDASRLRTQWQSDGDERQALGTLLGLAAVGCWRGRRKQIVPKLLGEAYACRNDVFSGLTEDQLAPMRGMTPGFVVFAVAAAQRFLSKEQVQTEVRALQKCGLGKQA